MATGCFEDKRGDCDDQSILFMSLCRAAGIPAWLKFGFMRSSFTDKWSGHSSANFYAPLKEGSYETPMVDLAGSQFLTRQADRFTEWTDVCVPGQFGTGLEQYEWQPGSLEQHYIVWQYSYSGSTPKIQISEEINLISYKA